MKSKITNGKSLPNIKAIREQHGWDLPRLEHTKSDLWTILEQFELLDKEIGINSAFGFRRVEEIGHRPKKNDPAIDPPVGVPTIWTSNNIDQALTAHYMGYFQDSAYLVEAMLGDARIAHATDSRITRVTKREAHFLPNPRAKDKKLAQYISDQFSEMYYDILPIDIQEQLWSWTVHMGWSLFNMVWELGMENMFLPTLRHWHPAYTFFLMHSELENRKLQAITMGGGTLESGSTTVPIHIGDPEWFHFAPFGEYRGWIRGVVRQVAIPWLVRNFSLRDWSRLGEIHGVPQRIIQTPANALEEDKTRIYNRLINLASEAVFVLPKAADGTGFEVSLLEPKTADSYKVLEQLAHRCDSDIMLAINRSQLNSALGDQKGGGHSNAASKNVSQEDGENSDSDCKKFAAAVRKQIFTPTINYNYEDAEDCVPLFELSDEPPADKVANSQVLLNLSTAAQNFAQLGKSLDYVALEEEYNIKFEDAEAEAKPEAPEDEPSEESIKDRMIEMLRKTMSLQTILISKDQYSLAEAKKWLSNHNYKTDVDEKEDTYRFRQRDPGDFIPKSFRTIDIADGIKFVMGKIKPARQACESGDT